MSATEDAGPPAEAPSTERDAPSGVPSDGDAALPAGAGGHEDWREPGRHYLVGIGCFVLVVLAVVGFYVWRGLG